MEEGLTIRTLRAQAWQRAKGELNAVLQTYWVETPRYSQMLDLVNRFIKTVDEEGLAE